MKVGLLVMVLAGALPAGQAVAGPLSDLIMAPGVLAGAPEGEVLRYAHTRRVAEQDGASAATPEAVADGLAVLNSTAGTGGPVLVLMLGKEGNMQTVAEFPAQGPNPMLLFFLENVVRSMAAGTGGSPYYIRNRMKDALVGAGAGEDRADGATVVLHPFDGDPNRERMGDFGALTLTLTYDASDPGRLVELLADTGAGASSYSERLKLIPEE